MAHNNEDVRDMLNRIRTIQESKRGVENAKRLLKEEAEKDENKDGIAITDDPKFGANVLSSQIQMFRSSVDGGAEFTEPSEDNVAESPLIFMPEDNNLVFSGTIPSLNNLKWQFKLRTNTGDGCFVWSDGLILNENNLKTLHKLQGFYENWKNDWQTESGDLERMAKALMRD